MATDTPEIIICPASGPAAVANVAMTVANGVPWSLVASLVAEESREALEPLVDESGELFFWGFRDNTRIKTASVRPPQSWNRMPIGTILVFTNRTDATHSAVVAARVYDPPLSEKLWGSDEFAWVVGLIDVKPLAGVSSAAVREEAGFTRVQTALPVREERRAPLLNLLAAGGGTTPAQVKQASREAISLATFDPDAPLSVYAETERRLEQGWLRKLLIPAENGECDLCGDILPAPFLRAAHIKRRADCTDEERRDPANVLVACVLCDIAFERGWVALDPSQVVIVSGSRPATAVLAARLSQLDGRVVSRPLTGSSLRFHREKTFSP